MYVWENQAKWKNRGRSRSADQGGERLDVGRWNERVGERKTVMQWTGSEFESCFKMAVVSKLSRIYSAKDPTDDQSILDEGEIFSGSFVSEKEHFLCTSVNTILKH